MFLVRYPVFQANNMQSRRMSMDLFAQLNLKECCIRSSSSNNKSSTTLNDSSNNEKSPIESDGSFNSNNKHDLLVPNYMILSPKPSLRAVSDTDSTLLSNELLVNATVTPSTTSSSLSSISKANNPNNAVSFTNGDPAMAWDELNRLTMLRREDFYSYPKGLFKQQQQQQHQQQQKLYENVLLSSSDEESMRRKRMVRAGDDNVSQVTEEDHIIEYDPELDRFTTTEYGRRQIILKSANPSELNAESLPLIESFQLPNQNVDVSELRGHSVDESFNNSGCYFGDEFDDDDDDNDVDEYKKKQKRRQQHGDLIKSLVRSSSELSRRMKSSNLLMTTSLRDQTNSLFNEESQQKRYINDDEYEDDDGEISSIDGSLKCLTINSNDNANQCGGGGGDSLFSFSSSTPLNHHLYNKSNSSLTPTDRRQQNKGKKTKQKKNFFFFL